MPKTEIDYSNTIIYKISCKDIAVTDVYVGHTTNFVQRKHSHKQNCLNAKSACHHCKVYEVIRANGSWDNWKMEIINFFECANLYEARQKEQEYFVLLKATLNSVEPFAKVKVKSVVIPTVKPKVKPTVIPDVSKINTVIIGKFYCKICNTATNNKKDYNKHLLTRKHIKREYANQQESKEQILETKPKKNYDCSKCNKKFDSNSGLWRHNKKCGTLVINTNKSITNIDETKLNDIQVLSNLVLEVVKSNTEFQKQTIEFHKQIMVFQKQILDIVKNT